MMKAQQWSKFSVEKEIRALLKKLGCKVRVTRGIMYIEAPDGSMWDMTVPMIYKAREVTRG